MQQLQMQAMPACLQPLWQWKNVIENADSIIAHSGPPLGDCGTFHRPWWKYSAFIMSRSAHRIALNLSGWLPSLIHALDSIACRSAVGTPTLTPKKATPVMVH